MTGEREDFEKQEETNIKWHLRNGAPTDCFTTPAESLPMSHRGNFIRRYLQEVHRHPRGLSANPHFPDTP